jgi:hypothetical protein
MKIKLPDFIIADLYKDTLVVNDVATPLKKPAEVLNETAIPKTIMPAEKKFLGGNKKQILFLVNDANAVFISDEMLDSLTKILTALKMNLNDVAIVNLYQQPQNFQSLKAIASPKYLFLFDNDFLQLQLPFTIPNYQIQQYDNCTFMIAPAISLSSSNDENVKKEKIKLWGNLKKIFG